MSEEHEITVKATAAVQSTVTLTSPEEIDEMDEHITPDDWKPEWPPEVNSFKCSCGEQFATFPKAELHLMDN